MNAPYIEQLARYNEAERRRREAFDRLIAELDRDNRRHVLMGGIFMAGFLAIILAMVMA